MPKSQSLKVSAVMPASPEQIYRAWLSGKSHAAMTGSPASGSAREGGKFTAWDKYIYGKTLKLVANRRIVQSWRSTEFPEEAPDSQLEVTLVKSGKGTRITLKHSNIPAGQKDSYLQGWKDYYFVPMKQFFESAARP